MAGEEAHGRMLLVETEEGNLDDLLNDLRATHKISTNTPASRLGLQGLDNLWNFQGDKRLEITGRGGLPLLYHIISTAVSAPRNGTVAVVDADGRFDVSRLKCTGENLRHVHVFRPAKRKLRDCLDGAKDFLLGGGHGSMGRELVGVMVNGGVGGDVCVCWRGWLRVENEGVHVPSFGMGMSVEEALGDRKNRQTAVNEKGWRAISESGYYKWKES